LKCLSISQPFADLIISGKKIIELRNWNTNFRGEFLIHAPLKIKTEDYKRLKINKIIGKAELYDVKKYNSFKEIREDQKFHFAAKKFQNKIYGFKIRNVKILKIPIPCKGQLGFFNVELTKIKNKDILSDIIDEEYRYQWINHH